MNIRLNRYVNIMISLLLLTGCSMHVAAEIRKPAPLALHKEVQEEVRDETPTNLLNVEKTGNIVLLCYHALCKEAPTQDPWQFFRLAADFEKDLELIQKSGIKAKSYGELLNALKNNDPSVKEPAIILQFDDGLMSDFTLAYPLLKKSGTNPPTLSPPIGRRKPMQASCPRRRSYP